MLCRDSDSKRLRLGTAAAATTTNNFGSDVSKYSASIYCHGDDNLHRHSGGHRIRKRLNRFCHGACFDRFCFGRWLNHHGDDDVHGD